MPKEKPKQLKIRVTDIIRRTAKQDQPEIPDEKSEKLTLPTEADKALPWTAAYGELPQRRETPVPAREEEASIEKFEIEERARFGIEGEKRRRRRFTLANITLVFVALLALGSVVYSVLEILPRATIALTLAKTPWTFAEAVTASKDAAAVDPANKIIPAQIFTADKNFTFSYPANGKKQVKDSARGVITITNAYSSAPQVLVAGTRFADPAGHIFRLAARVTIPGAKVQNGKIIPSSIAVAVTADKPGAEYNIDPAHFTIPGFKDSTKYAGFYGDSKNPMAGGLVGVRTYPTPDDLEKAKIAARGEARKNIESFLLLQIPQDLKVIDGSRQFTIAKETPSVEVDSKGNFGYFIAAQSSVVAFRESDAIELIAQLAEAATGKTALAPKEFTITYGGANPDTKNGKMAFAADFKGTLWNPVKADDIKQAIRGKSEADVRGYLLSIPDRERTTVTFWPFWVGRVPNDLDRITITIE